MLFPHNKAFFDHDKKIVKKSKSGTGLCILTRKKSKIYNIDGPEGS